MAAANQTGLADACAIASRGVFPARKATAKATVNASPQPTLSTFNPQSKAGMVNDSVLDLSRYLAFDYPRCMNKR